MASRNTGKFLQDQYYPRHSLMKELKVNSDPGPIRLSNNLMKEITPYIMDILMDLDKKILFADEMPNLEPFNSTGQ